MTDNHETLIGQKLMLAFDGLYPPARIFEWIHHRSVAGFTLFRSLNYDSPRQLRALTESLQWAARAAGRPPLLIAVDQEGGQLTGLGEGATQFAGNMALGAARDPELAQRVGRAIGLELAAVGVNVNYGPVVDLSTQPRNPALGTRAFGDDPHLAAALGAAMVGGLQSAGVAATLKHFPGLGEATLDSHHAMPVISHGRDRLEQVELAPFRAGVAAGAKLLMTGHCAVPALTGTAAYPVTVARRAVGEYARRELGFGGVVISDALDMGAITQGAGQIVDAVAALRAGVDLLLLTADDAMQERLLAGLCLAASRELIEERRLLASTQRALSLATWANRVRSQPPLEIVGCDGHRALEAEVARRSITLVRDAHDLLPLRLPPDARVAAVMPQPLNRTPADTSATVTPELATALRRHHPRVDEFVTAHAPQDDEIAALRRRLAGYDLIVLGTIDAAMQPRQVALARELLALGIPTVTVALRTPYDLPAYPQATCHLAAYSIRRPSLDALADALFGKFTPAGQLPVRLSAREPAPSCSPSVMLPY